MLPTLPSQSPARSRAHPRRSARRAARAGVTLPELFLALTLVAILAAIAGPRVTALRARSAVRSARAELTATLEAARAAALQKGRRGRFRVTTTGILAVVDTGRLGMASTGTLVVLGPAQPDFGQGVTVTVRSPADSTITWDARGLAAPRLPAVARFVLTRGAAIDSVCVSRFGIVLPRGCAP